MGRPDDDYRDVRTGSGDDGLRHELVVQRLGHGAEPQRREARVRPSRVGTVLNEQVDLAAGLQLQWHAELRRLRQRLHRVATILGFGLRERSAVDQHSQHADARDPQHMRTVDAWAVARTHHDLGVWKVHGRGQVVPPGEDAGWETRIAHDRAVGGTNLHTHAGLTAHRIMKTSVLRGGDGRAGYAPLMHADVRVKRFAHRVREAFAGDREHANATSTLPLRLDRIRADERDAFDAAAAHRQQPTGVAEQDERSRRELAQ